MNKLEDLDTLDDRIKESEAETARLKADAKTLRFAAICELLGLNPARSRNAVLLLTFPSGNQERWKFGNSDSRGDAVIYIETPRDRHMGSRVVFLDMLRKGEYDGNKNPKIEVIDRNGETTLLDA